jgi:hypothetical protein
MNKKVLLGLAGAAAFIALLAALTLGGRKVRVEVCMEFMGRQRCKIASGPDQQSAIRTATDNACADIASGMTESIQCTGSRPASVRVLTE